MLMPRDEIKSCLQVQSYGEGLPEFESMLYSLQLWDSEKLFNCSVSDFPHEYKRDHNRSYHTGLS